MTLVDLLHIVTVLFILFLFRTINSLLDKLFIARRQLECVRESRDNWRDIATLRTEKKP